MEKLEFQKRFPMFSEVFQDEHGVLIGYTRQTVKVTGTAGKKLQIGDFLVMDSVADEVATIPADIAAIKAAPVLAIYAGNEAYQNMNTDNSSYNHNVTEFLADRLEQEVVVINRGPIGLSWGGPVGTTKHFSGLKFPAGTSKADIKEVHAKLTNQGFKILRQVP
ncbi:virion structural protein [Acinetobacter phage vB_AbaM_P1]|nr:virion structural protein [Acinetobacter phage vB_AbaM_P1]